MSRTIYKYPLQLEVEQVVITPPVKRFLSLDWQFGRLYLWAEVDLDQPEEAHHIFVVGTGHTVPEQATDFLGTVQMENGTFVWHVYTDGVTEGQN